MSTSQTPIRMDEVLANIRAEMARTNVTQTQLAELLGLSQVAVSKRMRGVVPLSVGELLTLATFLRVAPSDLLKDAAA